MATVTFVGYDGTKHEADLVEGDSLMKIATENAIPATVGARPRAAPVTSS